MAIMDMFPTDEAAEKWVIETRWPNGEIGCPHCGTPPAWLNESMSFLSATDLVGKLRRLEGHVEAANQPGMLGRNARGAADAVLPHQNCDRDPRLAFLQDANDLTLREPRLPDGESCQSARRSNILWSGIRRSLPDHTCGVSAAAGGGCRLLRPGTVSGAAMPAVRRQLRDREAVRAAVAGDVDARGGDAYAVRDAAKAAEQIDWG